MSSSTDRPQLGKLVGGRLLVGLVCGTALIALLAVLGQRLAPSTVADTANAPAPATNATSQAESTQVLAAKRPLAQAIAAAESTAATPDGGQLSYRWQNGQQYMYRIVCKAEVGDTILETTGTNTYTAGRPPDTMVAGDESEARQGSGTAFIISPDGYLVTCDHVVRGATDIKVTLGNETIPCKVVGRDSAHDVAVLHVARQGLPALPLADSETVELAEEVRAVGFPLSNVLGSSMKVTQGSISGIVAKARGKVFQIDAVVNPGNSGGPLLNDRGAVVGVVNAQLVGFEIAKVGFAVPVNYAKALLTKHHVALETPTATDRLDGPTLAKRVSPSVALVTMLCHGDDFSMSDDGQPTLYYHGIFERRKKPRSMDDADSTVATLDSDRDDGRLIVDEAGDISHFDGHVNLPCLLGPLGLAPIDALPSKGEKTWERQETLLISVGRWGSNDPLAGVRPSGFLPRRGPLPPPLLPPYFWDREEPEPQCSATQQISYSIDKPQGSTVLIHKKLTLKTLASARISPRFELSGTGETLFDVKAGLPKKNTFTGTFVMREDGQTATVPVTLLCELVAQSDASVPPPPASAYTTPAPVVTEPAEAANKRLDGLLADLSAVDRDWAKCFEALQTLSVMGPIEGRRDEVSEVLNLYLAEKSYSARLSALRAARTWGTRRNVPALIASLDPSAGSSVRRRAIEALGNIGDEKVAAAIAERMKDPSDRATAARALRMLGRLAEDATIPLLTDKDANVRNEACAVLGEIGGAKSIAALNEQLVTSDAATRLRIKAALDKLREK